MKRKTIGISVSLILVCGAFYFIYKHYARVENRILKEVTFNDDLVSFVDKLYYEHEIPIVLEGFDHTLPLNTRQEISYSAKKMTVRQLLDSVVPQTNFTWTTDGDVIHIISPALAARPDYQMNSVIEHFSAKNADRNTLIKLALAQVEKNNISEPLVFEVYPYAKNDIIFAPPKISINMKHATLREILDRISLKAGICYQIMRTKNYNSVSYLGVPPGEYVLGLVVLDDLVPRFGSRVHIQKH